MSSIKRRVHFAYELRKSLKLGDRSGKYPSILL